jgi:hypothetical protein
VLEVAARDLLGLAAGEADDEDVLAAVAGEADAVQLVEDAGEAARGALSLVLLLVGVVANACGEGDARRVRRPGDRLDAFPQVGEAAGLATLRRNYVEIRRRFLVAAPVRGEGEPLPVRGPAWRAVAPLAGGEPSLLYTYPSPRDTTSSRMRGCG